MRTWQEILALSVPFLEARGVPEAQVAAELLVARLLKCGRGLIASRLGETPPERLVEAMRRGVARLVKGEPVQYVLGEWDFRTLTLKCDRRALIPRPETEILAGLAIDRLRARAAAGLGRQLAVDVGAGSGCISLSLAAEFADVDVIGVDVSPEAVALAAENAALTGLGDRVHFVIGDGLDDFSEPGLVDLIVSNPPYIASADCRTLDPRIRDFEPMTALDGGPKGLDFYERYVVDAINVLKPGGALLFEIGDTQAAAVRSLLFDCGFQDITVTRDYAGLDRVVAATLP